MMRSGPKNLAEVMMMRMFVEVFVVFAMVGDIDVRLY